MKNIGKGLLLAFAMTLLPCALSAQMVEKIEKPVILYSGTPHTYEIGGITVSGVKNYEDYVLIGISGLQEGQKITLPGDDITQAVKRYWKHGLFSKVRIDADSIVGEKIYLSIILAQRPRVAAINFSGVKKSEREDLEGKLGLIKGNQVTPNMIDRAKILIKRYFDDKGFKNATSEIVQRDDVTNENQVIIDINIDKKEKTKVNAIYINGASVLSEKKIKGVMKKTNEKGKLKNFFKTKKFIAEKYEEDKQNIISKYNELGYRDAVILSDSVVNHDDRTVDVYINLEEGDKYYVRHINWVGNTVYPADYLSQKLHMKRGDVYNQKLLNDRLSADEDAIGNDYYNHGYVFYDLEPVEVNIDKDSVDLEMRLTEGPQATINHVRINGNDRVYENVVRRELRTKPGDLFSKEALERTYREIAQMSYFDPEAIKYDVTPDQVNGTVDLSWGLTPKSSDQVELSAGWGQTGVIGKIGLKFGNFSIKNLFNRKEHRGIIPTGDGESFSISGQTNGTYYQQYSISYGNNWFGGKRPNSLQVTAFYSKQTDVSSNYYNNSYYNNYYNYYYGYGSYNSSYYNNYENYYDPDKSVQIYGVGISWGKRLRWPDDYFTFSTTLSYERYVLKDWAYFLISDGSCNNLNLNFTVSRNSTDNQIFPRTGSEFSISATFTPPYSLWDGKDYANLATDSKSPNYKSEQSSKYRWIEYNKWKFRLKTYTALANAVKCPVLMTRVEFGILGHYNSNKRSPFETFYMGGDGMTGTYSSYATETVGLRGYENGSLTPYGYEGYAYSRLGLELRYPLMLETSTSIYALAFAEGGNAWTQVKKFNPFDMKRSAGLGVRIFLPMVGMMGIDWAYGFDKVYGSRQYSGSQFHFIIGQEF